MIVPFRCEFDKWIRLHTGLVAGVKPLGRWRMFG
jgi:hypothetical protein